MSRQLKSAAPEAVMYCATQLDVQSQVKILRDQRTRQIYVEGRLLAKYRPLIDPESGNQLDETPDVDLKGNICVGSFRSTKTSTMTACNGKEFVNNPNLELIAHVPYDIGMSIIHGGHIPSSIQQLLDIPVTEGM